jgi:hypothetical protein
MFESGEVATVIEELATEASMKIREEGTGAELEPEVLVEFS